MSRGGWPGAGVASRGLDMGRGLDGLFQHPPGSRQVAAVVFRRRGKTWGGRGAVASRDVWAGPGAIHCLENALCHLPHPLKKF